jgi:hypothetical protein
MISRLCRYVDKVFDLSTLVEKLRDTRPQPQISTQTVWYCVFTMFATRRGSLNAWQSAQQLPKRVRNKTGPDPPSPDTIGRVFACLDQEPLREMLKHIHYRLKRNKVLPTEGPIRFLAVDGHEFFSQPTSELRDLLPTDPDH